MTAIFSFLRKDPLTILDILTLLREPFQPCAPRLYREEHRILVRARNRWIHADGLRPFHPSVHRTRKRLPAIRAIY